MYDNYNYPAGADTPDAPWNEPIVPEVEFDVTCTICLSKTISAFTNDYAPYIDPDDGHQECNTEDTNWAEVFKDSELTIPQLLEKLKEYVQKDLERVHELAIEGNHNEAFLKRKLNGILNACDNWTVDEESYVGE